MMKIECNALGTYAFYDEFLYVSGNYQKLLQRPSQNAKYVTQELKGALLLSILLTAFFLILSYVDFFDSYKDFFRMSGFFFAFLCVFFLLYYQQTKKVIHQYQKQERKAVLIMDQKGISLVYDKEQEIRLYWDFIAQIHVYRNSICVFPKQVGALLLAVDREYQEDIVKGLQKYHKEDLIIDHNETM